MENTTTEVDAQKAPSLIAAIPGWGADRDAQNRPGVPREKPDAIPRPAWTTPERQTTDVEILKRPDLEELTPVFGTSNPPRGLSGIIKRGAYAIPDHRPSHWLMLLFSDRVDVIEHNVAAAGKSKTTWAIGGGLMAGWLLWRRWRATAGVSGRRRPNLRVPCSS